MVPLFAVAVAAVAGWAAFESVVRRSDVGLGVALATLLASATLPDTTFRAAGFTIHLADIAYGLLAAAAVARLLRARRLTTPQLVLIGVLVLMAASFVRGVPEQGLQGTINSVRGEFYVFGGGLYFSTVEPHRVLAERFGRLWIATGLVLASLAVGRWAANAAGVTGGVFGEGDDLRVLVASEAFVITLALLITLLAHQRRASPGWVRWVSGGLLLVVVLLQHRTTWAVLLLSLGFIAVRWRDLAPRIAAATVVGAVLGSSLLLTVFSGTQALESDLRESASDVGTFEWRVEGWRALFAQNGPEDVTEVLFGKPYGSGWDRRVNGRLIELSPHNFYIRTVLRIGAIGLVLVLVLHVVPVRRLLRRRVGGQALHEEVLLVLLMTLPVYYITYAAPPFSAVIIGLAASWSVPRPAPVGSGARQPRRLPVAAGTRA